MHRKIIWGFHCNYIWFTYKRVVIHHSHVIQIGKNFTDVSNNISHSFLSILSTASMDV